MASSSVTSDRPDLPAPVGDSANDPFVSASSTTSSHLRFSDFDQELFAAGPGSDPRQAKRALEAHLAETDRRLDEAGKLGTALVSQRKALAEQLQEIEKLQAEEELAPELRKKLVDIEKDYNNLARESARVFLPKQRVASSNENQGSPYMLESRSGRRSVSPSKFESQATGSPTKLSVPNRKLRNQSSNRVHDIEFAAEISTSLIAQVRNLQTLLGERDEQVKDLRNDVSRLEGDSEALQQRLKVLDESEHRFKEENWNLQTRLQEMNGQQKEASDREKKLDNALHASNAAKSATQKELDEVKLSLSKLTEEHAATKKHHDIELGTAKRAIAMAEGERSAMQRKIDELTSQNLELAKAIAAQRAKAQERESSSGTSDEDLEASAIDITPEHSPPQSPMKGTTPRHSMLETETLKTSLQHAQRTIQSQRSQLHREKTEKLEFRRIIQDLRDDLEKARNELEKGPAPPPVRRGRRVEPKEVKVRPPRLLGSFRSSRQEVVMEEPVVPEDPEWEDAHDVSPRSSGTRAGAPSPERRQQQQQQQQQLRQQQQQLSADGEETILESIETSDQFETAAEEEEEEEAGESAFETAEPGTETEDFQTGNEDISDESDAPTEVALSIRGFGKMKRPPSLQPGSSSRHVQRDSFDSTASTSTDDDDFLDYPEYRTPTAAASLRRMRMRGSQSRRSSRQESEEPQFQSPGASFSSGGGDPSTPGQSLFAELQDFGSDDESIVYTPGRRSLRSMTPASTRRAITPPPAVPPLPRVIMVDSGVMTDPIEFGPRLTDLDHQTSRGSLLSVGEAARRPRSMESVVPNTDFRASAASWRSVEEGPASSVTHSRPASTVAYSDAGAQYDIGEKLAQFPLPPSSLPGSETDLASISVPVPAVLNISAIQSEHIEPREEEHEEPAPAPPPPALSLTPIAIETVEPLAEPEVPAPDLTLSVIVAEHLEPKAEPEVPPPDLTLSSIFAEGLEPRAEPEVPAAELTLSTIVGEDLEPVAEPEIPPPVLSLSAIATEGSEPVAEPELPAPVLSLSYIVAEDLEPKAEPEAPLPELTITSILSEEVEPVVEPELPALTAAKAIALEAPAPAPAPALQELSISPIATQQVEPIAEPVPAPEETMVVPLSLASLTFSSIQAQQLEPREQPPLLASLALSTISVENVEPIPEPAPVPAELTFSTLSFQNTIPVDIDELPIDDEELLLPQTQVQTVVPTLGLSTIVAENVEPVSPIVPQFAFSPISSVDTQPISPTKREGFILPRDIKSPFVDDGGEISDRNLFASYVTRRRPESVPSSPIIAEDETSQSRPASPQVDTPESQRPFKEISANGSSRPGRQQLAQMSDQGAQTSLTSGAIDQLMKTDVQTRSKSHSISSLGSPDTLGTVKIHRPYQESLDSPASAISSRSRTADAAAAAFDSTPTHRPGSAASAKSTLVDAPPLPSNHQQIIQAARSGSSNGTTQTQNQAQTQSHGTTMGPPLWPASATKPAPRTPSQQRPLSPASGRGTPTPRAPARAGSSHGTVEFPQPPAVRASTALSRQSSVSSFVSELDTRFGMRASEMGVDPSGFGPNTDPRMIQAITQTMIGEYIWKYTRKTGRGELSEKRHRRYFWVHPYTRTIYWSDKDPSTAGRTEMKAKSLPIEGVRVVTDDNPMPPGLHRKSLVIISPGRTIKFTCTTGQRHETWFNALSYLLLRTSNGNDGHYDAEEMAADLTREDVDEFNPQFGRRPANGSSRPSAPSLSSYNSRTTRNESQAEGISLDIPTLTPSGKHSSTPIRPSVGSISSRVGSYWKVGGSKLSGTIRSRTASAQNVGIYEASEVHDSAEDLREMIERQDRDADRLENVRACCDGKHDVGTLPHSTKRSRSHNHHHHPNLHSSSALNTPMASMRSRA
ncbi:anucleate primary sterigmata a [Trichoderma arundinaceum]|uniref:Anucleate primary sterigmata a n=1 Tax=Trichoderma arundinaceum TaxID=490622 RepID=A0A395NDK9_TRIAR|nr:anucleate primary sterigmata a [Trichoderma arundinaceum]